MTRDDTPQRPASSEVVRSLRRTDETGTVVEEVEWIAAPGWAAPPLHQHPDAEERYEILDGLVHIVVDGAGRTYRSDESVIVGRGQLHALEPVDGHGVHVRVLRWFAPQDPNHRTNPKGTPVMTDVLDAPTADDPALRLLIRPDDPNWDTARSAWNLAVDQRPAAVAFPETADDVVALVAHARTHGLRVAPQGTGHNASAIATLEGALLVKTSRMREVVIDPVARTARVGAGVLWEEVATAAGKHGLAALSGSSPDVGVVGYTLGGGVSWLARAHGLSCNKVTAIELVTADARLVRATAEVEPELFWALRGGGGSFGIVTAIELELLPIAEVFAGAMFWPAERTGEVLHRWRQLTPDLPETMTSVARMLQMPPFPDVPEALRGRAFVVVEAIFLGDAEEGTRLLEPLRSLLPEIDTLAMIPPAELVHLHMDPEQPVPGAGHGWVLRDLPAEAVEALLASTGPGTDSPLLALDVRHIGGALGRAPEGHGALAGLGGDYMVFAVGIPETPEIAEAIGARIARVGAAVEPWTAETTYLNFVEEPADARSFFSAPTYARLREAKRRYDPTDLFLSNHPIPPAKD